jgi:hypothetical protein
MSVTQKGFFNQDNQERDQRYPVNFQNIGKDGDNYTQSLIDDEEDEEDDAIALELDDDMDEEDASPEGSEDMTVEFEEDETDEDDDFIEEGEDMVIEANEEDLANTLLDDEDDEDDL